MLPHDLGISPFGGVPRARTIEKAVAQNHGIDSCLETPFQLCVHSGAACNTWTCMDCQGRLFIGKSMLCSKEEGARLLDVAVDPERLCRSKLIPPTFQPQFRVTCCSFWHVRWILWQRRELVYHDLRLRCSNGFIHGCRLKRIRKDRVRSLSAQCGCACVRRG